MSMISEKNSVEDPVFNWLGKLGWELIDEIEIRKYNRPLSEPILKQIFLEKVAEINEISEDDAKKAYDILIQQFSKPNLINANEYFLKRVNEGINVNIEGKDITLRVIDFENIWQNSFIATKQYWVQHKKPDIVLLINGIPFVCIEAKQRARRSTNWLEGVRQFRTYSIDSPKLFVTNCFGVVCNGRLAKYGIPGVSSEYFFEWKDNSINIKHDNPLLTNGFCEIEEIDNMPFLKIDPVERMKYALLSQLQPAKVIDILQNFIVFERTQEFGVVKKIARYQQYRAANKIVDRVTETQLNQGIIWHTQGSGKSLTMLFTAYKLRNHSKLNNPTVYIIVDRKNLRTQIGDTFEDCLFPNTSKPENIGQLIDKIKTHPSEVIITNIQKFRDLGNNKDENENVIALIDEAHRSQYGEFQSELKYSLPNCKRFAFTGTPITKTQKEFSIRKEGKIEPYLDDYNIPEAIEDKAIVPIRYTFGRQEWFLDREKLKQGFEEITKDLDEEEKRKVSQAIKSWKVFMKKDERIREIAEDIAKDFREKLEPNGFKAQIVAIDKETCVKYYNEFINRKLFDPSEIAIVYSPSSYEDKNYEMLKIHDISDGELKTRLKKFRKRITPEEISNGNNLKILIVCHMLLTGFDAQIEQTMYLDSPIKDHNLLQAIARTNRPYEDEKTQVRKEFGRIVDYVGIFKNLNEALNYDPNDIGDIPDVDSLAKTFPEKVEMALKYFEDIKLEDSYDCSINIIKILSKIDHTEFEKRFKNTLQLYEAISPHPIIIEVRERYRWLLTIYEIYLEEFKRTEFNAEIYAAKTRKLIDECSKLLQFHDHLPEIKIDENYIENLKNTKLSPYDMAEKIIRDIETVVRKNELENPAFIDFAKRLEEVVNRKNKESENIEGILKDLNVLYFEIDNVSSLPQKEGFPDRASFDMYLEIKNKYPEFNKEIIKSFTIDFASHFKEKIYPGWQDYKKEINNLRIDIKLFLAEEKYEELHFENDDELINKICERIIQHYKWS